MNNIVLSLLALILFSKWLPAIAAPITPTQPKKLTIVVAKNSGSAKGLEDGFAFKSTKGKEYYIYYNGDSSKAELRAGDLVMQSEKKQTKICITVEDNIVLSASPGRCKK
jgi:hypothetical protein